MRAVLVLAIAATLLAAVSASGQVPAKMNYQVMLTNNSDEPLADQAVTLVFRIYNSDIGGVMLWNETHATTTNSIGVVSAVLGTTTPFSPTLFHQPLWVEVEVDGETLTPRRELVSAPYALHASDSDKLGMIVASEYTLREDLFVPGSINSPSNPVDWTMLKNVPAGFADGADDTGGAGDGHSLDADDGSPVDAVYVDSLGNVGIGTTAPANRLTVSGGGGLSYAQFASVGTGYGADDGFEVGINGSGDAFINQQEALSISFMTNGTLNARLRSDGMAQFYAAGGASPSIELFGNPLYGGRVRFYEEDGTRYGALEADHDGTGGVLEIYDGNGVGGFRVDGNYMDGSAVVSIDGSASGTYFDTSSPGNSAVLLPMSAVSAPEILDEAGVASYSGTTSIHLSGPVETLLSGVIVVPAPGYVLAIVAAEAVADHITATTSGCNFGVSNNSSSLPPGGGNVHPHPQQRGQRTLVSRRDRSGGLRGGLRRPAHVLLPCRRSSR